MPVANEFEHAVTLYHRGRLRDAERLFRAAVKRTPQHADAWQLLGVVAFQRGRLEDAVASFRRSVELAPDFAPAHNNLGLALAGLGKLEISVKSYRKALELHPGFADAHCNLGSAYFEMGQHADAIACYRRAIAADANHAAAYLNLGVALEAASHNDEEVIACFQRVIALNPNDAEAHCKLGLVLRRLQRLDEAIAHYRRAIAIEPDMFDAHYNLGNALVVAKQPDEAIASYRRAAALSPKNAEVYYNLALTFIDKGRFADAQRIVETTLELAPDHAGAIDAFARCCRSLCDWERAEKADKRVRELIAGGGCADPLLVALLSPSAKEQFDCATRYSLARMQALQPHRRETRQEQIAIEPNHAMEVLIDDAKAQSSSRQVPRKRLRIAYFSSDFYAHATSILLAGVIEAHDRDRFEIIAYDYSPKKRAEQGYRQRVVEAFDRFVPVCDLGHDQFFNRVVADGADILIDLKGWTAESRSHYLSSRPAPVQMQWLGFPGTMGAPWIDYILADHVVIGEGEEVCYAEKVLRLPDCYQPNDDRRARPEPSSRADCGLPEDALVFGCFNQHFKFTPEVFAIWMRLLQQTERSVLWLLDPGEEAASAAKARAAELGVAAERLIFGGQLPYAKHLARIAQMDIALDCFPYTSHTTASDALWMGVPLVGLSGPTFAGRVSESILKCAGLQDLVTRSLEDYFNLALRMATDSDMLAGVKTRVRRSRQSPLFDTRRFTRHLELGFDLVWERHLAGLAPDHVEVPATPPQMN